MFWLKRIGTFLAIWMAIMFVGASLLGLVLISFSGEAEVMSVISLIVAAIITARLIPRPQKPPSPAVPVSRIENDMQTVAEADSQGSLWLKRTGVFLAVWFGANLVGSVITSTILYILSGGDPGDAALRTGMNYVAVLSIIVAFTTTGPITARLTAPHGRQG